MTDTSTNGMERTPWRCNECQETFDVVDGETATCPSCGRNLGRISDPESDCDGIPIPSDVGRIDKFEPGDDVPKWLFPAQQNAIVDFGHPVAVLSHGGHYHLVPRKPMGDGCLISVVPVRPAEPVVLEAHPKGVYLTGDSGGTAVRQTADTDR